MTATSFKDVGILLVTAHGRLAARKAAVGGTESRHADSVAACKYAAAVNILWT